MFQWTLSVNSDLKPLIRRVRESIVYGVCAPFEHAVQIAIYTYLNMCETM